MTKLFLYKARDAPIVAILRRGAVKDIWELIQWNTDTDTFTRGQWLTKAVMNGAYNSISPDGRHFAYFYSSTRDAFKSYAVISKIPYFTASLITDHHAGCWDAISFDTDGAVIHTQSSLGFTKKRPCDLPIRAHFDESRRYTGFVESFTDSRGRNITVDGATILANGTLLYDTTSHTFQSVACPIEPLAADEVVFPT